MLGQGRAEIKPTPGLADVLDEKEGRAWAKAASFVLDIANVQAVAYSVKTILKHMP
jgi:hypothetical protein